MKAVLHKSSIPPSQIFVIRQLEENHFDPVWHAHSEYQLFVVLEGTGTRFIGDNIRPFRPGELIFTGPDLPHLWHNDPIYFDRTSQRKCHGIVIYFNEHFLGEQIIQKEEMLLIRRLFSKSMRGLEFFGPVRNKVIELMQELVHLKGISSVIQLLQILALLASTRDYQYISSRQFDEHFNQHETDRLNKVYEYVFKNFRNKLSLEAIADLLHMTPTSFSRYFTTRNNKTFSRFIAEIRIKHACEMLTESDASISEISYECGFNTISNFNRQFKEIMLSTPGRYKKEFESI